MRSSSSDRPPSAARWLLVTDIDDTLLGDEGALAELLQALRDAAMPIALNSSRPTASVRRTIAAAWPPGAPPADAVITALGTEIDYAGCGHDDGWERRFKGWPRTEVDRVIRALGFAPHAEEFQTPYKASFAVPASAVAAVEAALDAAAIARRTIHSGDSDFDVIPPDAGKAEAMFRVSDHLAVAHDHVIVAGDSGNDLVMFEHASRGVVVGNGRTELRDRVDRERAYLATDHYAAGILEGLRHWGLIPERRDR
ncbi:MAG: HAD hydrolase family protein [Chloroflexi bacterium]|nr:HAD hydrolase family protein [Chloroflexota bacterium]MDA1145295.1 HAD hydrolase family protein [Chloroflexota bacterium]